MTVEADLFACLGSLVSNRVYPDVAPSGADKPYLTYQQVGGDVVSYIETSLPNIRNGRFQINTWATTRLAAAALARQAESALVTSATLRAKPLAAPVATYESETLLYGMRQFFSIWFDT
ncbi:MAG: DUF3168 domain-containing protein [Proteobacteria bacterium]|nr:DUF3168 domain-containing protein [Pseudomonadota bacterium]